MHSCGRRGQLVTRKGGKGGKGLRDGWGEVEIGVRRNKENIGLSRDRKKTGLEKKRGNGGREGRDGLIKMGERGKGGMVGRKRKGRIDERM